ncbi:MAG: GNAT family N-acetyltransferase [Methanobacterium sp.]
MEYKEYEPGQEQIISELVWEVFEKFEAPEYPEAGIATFKTYIAADNLKELVLTSDYRMYCCFDSEQLLGVITIRDQTHISLLFVREEFHRKGIARNLLKFALDNQSENKKLSHITVNSSPYARTVYERMGFKAITELQEKDGILFIPMIKKLIS